MVADFLDKPRILEDFRLINGVPGITEAVIRWYGPIRATRDGFTKNPDYAGPTPIEIVRPLSAAKAREQRMALRYLVYSLESGETGAAWRYLQSPLVEVGLGDDVDAIVSWGDRTPWVRKFRPRVASALSRHARLLRGHALHRTRGELAQHADSGSYPGPRPSQRPRRV